jgi:hypothetical protein
MNIKDMTTEEAIEARARLAERCGLLLTRSGVYLLDGDELCERRAWQPDFDDGQAVMVMQAVFSTACVEMQPGDCPSLVTPLFRCVGCAVLPGGDVVQAKSGWQDSLAYAVFEAAVEATKEKVEGGSGKSEEEKIAAGTPLQHEGQR